MKLLTQLRHSAVALLSLSAAVTASQSALSSSNTTVRLLDANFEPPNTLEIKDLIRTINLERSYPRENTNLEFTNVGKEPVTEFYYEVPTEITPNIGGFIVTATTKDGKQDIITGELAQYRQHNARSYYIITLSEPVKPSGSLALSIMFTRLSAVTPLPAEIEQADRQTITYSFSAYAHSPYTINKQMTKLKIANGQRFADFTKLDVKNTHGTADPSDGGSALTYGPYAAQKPHTTHPATVRYEFTKALVQASRYERDIEVSHWGGNLATEERYWLTNRAAKLKNQFSRVHWQMTSYANPPTTAGKELRVPLAGGVSGVYFTDDIGNVTTSRFRPGEKQSELFIRPRYPLFGGWNYKFRIGWDADLSNYLRRGKGEQHILKVPFMEGFRTPEGVSYEKVVVRIVLPEGAKNIDFHTSIPLTSHHYETHRTFLDTIGRPTLVLTAVNAVEEWRMWGDVTITYDYPLLAMFRKPLVISAAVFTVFFVAWAIGNVNVRIGKEKRA